MSIHTVTTKCSMEYIGSKKYKCQILNRCDICIVNVNTIESFFFLLLAVNNKKFKQFKSKNRTKKLGKLYSYKVKFFKFVLVRFDSYIDSPPRRSLGKNEFKLHGVPLGSLQSRGFDHKAAEDVSLDQPLFQESVDVGFAEPLQVPEELFC